MPQAFMTLEDRSKMNMDAIGKTILIQFKQ